MPDQSQMMKRQQVLADFGEFSIRSDSLDDVLTEACRLVGEALGTRRAKVLEVLQGRQELFVRAGVGWPAGVVGVKRLQMYDRSSETYAIKTAAPVISQDIAKEDRFVFPDFMREAGVVALVNVPIFVPGQRPYGILQVDASEPRDFGDDEIQFLRTYATILGPVVDRLHLLDERKRERERLRSSEVRHRLLVESWAQAVWEVDADGVVIDDSPSWRAYTGQSLDEWLGYGWLNAIHPDDRSYAEQQWRASVAAGKNVNAEFRLRSPDGGWRWTNVRAAPVLDDEGRIEKWAGMNIDIEVSKQAEAALRESEVRQRALIEGVPQLVWRASDPGRWTWASPQWTEFTGQREEDSRGWGWLEQLHPDDRALAREAWARATKDGAFEVDCRIFARDTGAYRWFQTRATPLRDDKGVIVEWLGTSTDVDDLRGLQARQQVLVGELQHRTRNLIGVVRSMADKTARASADLPDFRNRFRDQLEALSRVQGLLSRLNEGDRVTFDELIEAELRAMGSGADRIRLDGPKGVRLRSSMVQILAMALHELATNAVKYGALGQAGGKLAVTWSLSADEDRLLIDWRESGVTMPPVDAKPQGGGQGRELIERALPYQLSATTSYQLNSDGVHCTISIPISLAQAPDTVDA